MHSATHCVKVGARVRIRLKMAVQLGDRAVHAGACTYTVRREWQSVRVSEGRLNGTTHCCVSKQPSSVEMEGWIDSHPHGPVCKPTTSQRNDTIHIHTHSEQPHGTAGQAARSDEATKEHLDRTNPSPQHAALLHTLHRHTHTACAPRTCTTTMFTRIQHLQGARHAHRPESRTPAMLNQSARFVCEHETFWFGRKSIRAGACDPSSCPSTSRRRRSEHAYRAGLSLELARQRCECPVLVCHLLAGCDRTNFSGLYSMRAGQGKRNHETYEPVRRTPSFARARHLAVARGPGLSTSCWAI